MSTTTVSLPQPPSALNAARPLGDILPEVYRELRRLAATYLRGERISHTLQPTALVHEAFLRLRSPDLEWHNPQHVVAFFAHVMRQTLINHGVARRRLKRGGADPLSRTLEFYESRNIDVKLLHEVLEALELLDPRQAQIVELRFFGGLTIEEIADLLEISPATVKREWTFAKMWLRRELSTQ